VSALDAPSLSSNTQPNQGEWSNQSLIRLAWDPIPDATKYYYLRDTNPDTVPTLESDFTEENRLTANVGRDGIYYYHVAAAKGNNIGPASHYKIQLDLTNPGWGSSNPAKAIPQEDGSILVEWEDAIDASSGINHYRVHRDRFFDFDFRESARKYAPIVSPSYADTNNIEEGLTYFYLIVAVDNAGNQGRISNRAAATTFAFCDHEVIINANLSEDKQKLLVSIASDGELFGGIFTAALPSGETHSFFTNSDPFNEYSGELDLNVISEGTIKLDLIARERLGDDCSTGTEFIYDITEPIVEITEPELNEQVTGVVTVKANVFDGAGFSSGIPSVEFFVRTEDWISQGQMTSDTNVLYSIDWNSFNFNNGRHQIKVVVTDGVGNSTEAASGAIIFNTIYQRVDANAAITSALDTKEQALDFLNSLKKKNVVSGNLTELLQEADNHLAKAKELYELGGNEYTNARASANDAKEIFLNIQQRLVVEKTEEQTFVYNKEQAGILLNASSLDKSLVEKASILIAAAQPQRRLEIIKITDSNTVYYRANIIVSFSVAQTYLDENDLNFLKVVEFVPKELAASSDELSSFYDFVIVEKDPVIEFNVDRDQIALGEISYGLNRDLTEAEASALIATGTVNKYTVPPVLLHDSPALGFSLPSLPSLSSISFETIIIAIIILVIVAIVIVVLFFSSKQKKTKEVDLSIFE
tara:strand:+ start:3834 stop:5933 length:2100 start_codon:yes stop_codon:yes gene_type:complete